MFTNLRGGVYLSTFLEKLVHYVAYSMEIIGILIIIMSGIKALYLFVKDGFKFHNRLVSLTWQKV